MLGISLSIIGTTTPRPAMETTGQAVESVILPDKTHLTAIAIGAPMTPQYVDGIKEIENAVRLNPRYVEAYYLLNRLYQRANEPARAAAALAQAGSLKP